MKFVNAAKSKIRRDYPSLFVFCKKVTQLPLIRQAYSTLNSFINAPIERYYPNLSHVEDEYFKAYSQLITPLVKGDVMDIGCGYGYLTNEVATLDKVCQVVALDKIPLKKFRFNKNSKINYVSTDITKLSKHLGLFDVIMSTEFVEHIHEKDFVSLLSFIKKSLKPQGIFIGSTPNNKTSLEKPSACPFHVREYQPEYFKKLLTKHGFKNISLNVNDSFFVWKATL